MYHREKENGSNKSSSFRESRKQKKQEKLEKECHNVFHEELHDLIWPNTDIDKLLQRLAVCDKDSLEYKHGARQETLLHRLVIIGKCF